MLHKVFNIYPISRTTRNFGVSSSNYLKRNSNSTLSYKTAVWTSKSHCVFENIAFENYIYENYKFGVKERLLFIWRNSPSVVIGRHQNPWREVNLNELEKKDIKLCRRYSGGGTVYHDLGNINLTFFTKRAEYDRKENLHFLRNFFSNCFLLDLQINSKDDLLLNSQYKISGTAAKLGLQSAYHHCTLLCNTDITSMSGLLHNTFGAIDTNATKSVPSKTKNLFNHNIDFAELCKEISLAYHIHFPGIKNKTRLKTVVPLDFPISEKVIELKSYGWTFGRSPKFTVTGKLSDSRFFSSNITLTINKGTIISLDLSNKKFKTEINAALVGVKFNEICGILNDLGFMIKFRY